MKGMKLKNGIMMKERNEQEKRMIDEELQIEKLLENDKEKCERFQEKEND